MHFLMFLYYTLKAVQPTSFLKTFHFHLYAKYNFFILLEMGEIRSETVLGLFLGMQ